MSPFLEELLDGLGDVLRIIIVGAGTIAGLCLLLWGIGRVVAP